MLKPWQAWCFRRVPLFRLIGDLRLFGSTLGPHFECFWAAWGSFWWFGRVLGTGWNLDGFWDAPWDPLGSSWAQCMRGWVVKPWSGEATRGANQQDSNQPDLLIPDQQLDSIPDWLADRQLETGGNRTGEQQIGRLQSFASQPSGP